MRTKAVFRGLTILALIASLSACTQVISGVRSAPLESDPTTRTLGTRLNDELIETKIGVNIRKAHPDLARSHVNVISYHNAVLLVGQVPSQALKILATKVAEDVNLVRFVRNELTVEGKTSYLIRSNDSIITGKVKSRLTLAEGVRAYRIKVVTENSTVYLMGVLPRAEADKAAVVASETSGVRRVVSVFEYL